MKSEMYINWMFEEIEKKRNPNYRPGYARQLTENRRSIEEVLGMVCDFGRMYDEYVVILKTDGTIAHGWANRRNYTSLADYPEIEAIYVPILEPLESKLPDENDVLGSIIIVEAETSNVHEFCIKYLKKVYQMNRPHDAFCHGPVNKEFYWNYGEVVDTYLYDDKVLEVIKGVE